MTQFNVGDTVWIVTSGRHERYVECPDCFGQQALTVILGDGSQVSIECDCCKEGWRGACGRVKVYDWSCSTAQATITGMEIDGDKVTYRFAQRYPDKVFATQQEAEADAIRVKAEHDAEEAHRFSHVKERDYRSKTWAWHVTYHRRSAKEAHRQVEYHEGRLAVAKAKSKIVEAA